MHNYKFSIATFALCLLIFSGCKKNNENKPDPISDNNFKLDGKTYTVSSSSHYNITGTKKNGILFTDGKAGLLVMFKEYPTTAGKYKIVSEDSEPPATDECYIDAFDENGRGYYGAYRGQDNSIDVTIKKDGKIAIAVPQINVAPPAPSNPVTVEGSVYEK